jgi:hypothetical protein
VQRSHTFRPTPIGVLLLLLAPVILFLASSRVQAGFDTAATAACGSHSAPLHLSRPGHTPAYTVTDMAQYIKCTWANEPDALGHKPTITMIVFVTAAEAGALQGGEVMGVVPQDALVCYVQLQGTLRMPSVGPIIPNVRPLTPALNTAHIEEMVFDVHTGDLLVWGMRP